MMEAMQESNIAKLDDAQAFVIRFNHAFKLTVELGKLDTPFHGIVSLNPCCMVLSEVVETLIVVTF